MASPDLIARLREMIGDTSTDTAVQLWSDDQLSEFIDGGFMEYTYGERTEGTATTDDVKMSLKLAHSTAMYELATGTALFFKWRDQQKDIDKSMTPETVRRIGKDLHEQVMAHRKAKDVDEGSGVARPRGGLMQFDPSARSEGRPWY